MWKLRQHPLGVLHDATRTFAGWTSVIGITLALGLWVGACVADGGFVDLDQLLLPAILWPVAWLMYPLMVIAYGVTAVAWYLPFHYESGSFKVVAAVVNFIAWAVMSALWLRSGYW